MDLSPLTAISPLDGRYRDKLAGVGEIASEFGLLKFRVLIEIEWFIFLAQTPEVPQLPALTPDEVGRLRGIATRFDVEDAKRIKVIERSTNHDVKAVEYFVKERLSQHGHLATTIEFVHFACTSEDINNVAHGLTLADIRRQLLLPSMDAIIDAIARLAGNHADSVMLARTHGQAASPTTMGKELANFAHRLAAQRSQIAAVPILGKMNGAVGNFNAHRAAYPDADWPDLTRRFLAGLGLEQNPYTTQIEPHDYMAELFHAVMRFNQVLLDFDRDIWGYISIDYFRQRRVEGETGSSTMPHKVNPIDFENSEGNLGLANALLGHLAEKLLISRWQRDLSDSTVLRNLGVAMGYCLVAYQAALKGIDKLDLNEKTLERDLEASWEVLGEAVQTVMRKHGMAEPYEALKAATRGRRFDADGFAKVLDALDLPAAARAALAHLRPQDYKGFASDLAGGVADDIEKFRKP